MSESSLMKGEGCVSSSNVVVRIMSAFSTRLSLRVIRILFPLSFGIITLCNIKHIAQPLFFYPRNTQSQLSLLLIFTDRIESNRCSNNKHSKFMQQLLFKLEFQ